MSSSFSTAQSALDQAVADWNRAGAVWNAEALAHVYAEDGLLFGGRPGHYVGREAIRGYFASYDGAILGGAMQMSDTVLRMLSGDCVLAQGMVHFVFTLAGGKRTQSTLRATLVLTKEANCWHIADHHFSSIPTAPPLGND